MKIVTTAYGLVRSLAMLNDTLQSYAKHRSPDSSLIVVADCRQNCTEAARMIRTAGARHVTLRTRAPEHPSIAAFRSACKSRMHQSNAKNYLLAMQLLRNGLADAAHGGASAHAGASAVSAVSAVVAWRIDTRIVAPVDAAELAPWRHHRRIYVSRQQGGAGLHDRFMIASAEAARRVTDYRIARLQNLTNKGANASCRYGEPLLLDAVLALNLSVGFTRTRVVRVRGDLAVPDVDRSLVLREIPPRGWMRMMNRLPPVLNCSDTVCTVLKHQ